MYRYSKIKTCALVVILTLGANLWLNSCKDEVDESNMYTFTGQLMSDYLDVDSTLSYFSYLTKKVKLSDYSESTVYNLLSARGNFTCFAPTNSAVQIYLDSIYNTKGYDVLQTPDSTAAAIVNNCLIDHEDTEALLSTYFFEGTIEKQSFAGRFVTINFDTLAGGKTAIYIDKSSLITAVDLEMQNGVLHKVNRVVAPTTSSLNSLIGVTEDLQVFSNLLTLTGYDEVLETPFRDMVYEKNHPKTGLGTPTETGTTPVPTPEHRDIGFTAFVEKDEVYAKKFGLDIKKEKSRITNWEELLPLIEKKCKEYYPNATSSDYKSDNNAVHQFVGYHLVDRAIPYNYLNIHYNEQGYGYKLPENLGIDTWCYYPTLTQNRILKIMEGKQIKGKRINRYVSERNLNNFYELRVPREGILLQNEGDNTALNGYFYTIDDILVYDDDVPNKVLNERMRFDISDIFPEQMTSGLRRVTSGAGAKGVNIPVGYYKGMTYTNESRVVFLPAYGYTWQNYQGDEYNIVGQYDVTIELPHVPYLGTYEFRMGLQNVADRRGMMQVYFGTNKQNLDAIGLPLDMRIYGTNPSVGWQADRDDEDFNKEVEKTMRIHGYMKPPKYFGPASTAATAGNYRNNERVLRKILYTGTLDPKKTYYVRLKSVLENTETQLFIDYFEFCPKSVYNGVMEEDAW